MPRDARVVVASSQCQSRPVMKTAAVCDTYRLSSSYLLSLPCSTSARSSWTRPLSLHCGSVNCTYAGATAAGATAAGATAAGAIAIAGGANAAGAMAIAGGCAYCTSNGLEVEKLYKKKVDKSRKEAQGLVPIDRIMSEIQSKEAPELGGVQLLCWLVRDHERK